jgi:ABC-type uncharacterized transport system auxiliary subunit
VISSSTNGFRPVRRAGVLVPLMLAALMFGCGSSGQNTTGTSKELKEEERYRYEGAGQAKQKVLIRRKEERIKELRETTRSSSDAAKDGN